MTGWELGLVGLAALVIGISKTSVGGFAAMAVAVFATVLPAKESTAAVLLLLITGDVVGVTRYRRSADWGLLRRLLPSVLPGVALGAVFMWAVSDLALRRTIGGSIAAMVLVQVWQRRRSRRAGGGAAAAEAEVGGAVGAEAGAEVGRAEHPLVAVAAGVAAGFTTMTANAAGAVMTLYLLAMRVEKLRFIGTSAWFFLIVNVSKVPFSAGLGLFRPESLRLVAMLVPVVLVGTWLGVLLIRRLSQVTFERAALAGSAVAAVALLVR